MKLKTVRGAGAKAKGSRAERQWRDELKRIYKDAKLHDKIKRVPMSGASWMKGGTSRTPVLVITQNHRPFYVFMEEHVLNSMMTAVEVNNMGHVIPWKKQKGLLDAIDRISQYDYVLADVGVKDHVELAGIQGESYIQLKKLLTNDER